MHKYERGKGREKSHHKIIVVLINVISLKMEGHIILHPLIKNEPREFYKFGQNYSMQMSQRITSITTPGLRVI